MNNKEQIDNMPREVLLATRKLFLGIIESGRLEENVNDELRELVLYIETKLKRNNISLNTYVSQSDMEKAQRYMSGFSGINDNNNNNYYENDSDGFEFVGGFVGVMIVITLIGSFFRWLGEILTDLWSKGIIQIVLGGLGVGGLIFLGYKLYENGTFEKIKKYFEDKEKQKLKEKAKKINLSKTKEKTNTSSSKNNNTKSDTTKSSIKRLVATATAITVLGTGYHILDTNTFNGKKISLMKGGRLEDKQYQSNYKFNKLLLLGKNINYDDIMYDINDDRTSFFTGDYYRLDYDKLQEICSININDVNRYMKNESYSFEPSFYFFDRMFFTFFDGFDTLTIKMFNDYRNGIVYCASHNKQEELENTIIDFIKTCDLFIMKENTYQLGNPVVQASYKFRDLSPLAQMVVLNICDAILRLNITYIDDNFTYFNKNSSKWEYININTLKRSINDKLDNFQKKNVKMKYIKFPTLND